MSKTTIFVTSLAFLGLGFAYLRINAATKVDAAADDEIQTSPIDPSNPEFQARISTPRPPLPGVHPDYQFENVAFGGGGGKGPIYCGTLAALEELGIYPYLKRFAGTSAGSLCALAMALGVSSEQAMTFLANMTPEDGPSFNWNPYNWYQILSSLLDKERMGIHPGKRLYEQLGDFIEKCTGVRDLTFRQLYDVYGVELCIPISNVSRSQSELCHVKLTPDMPIRKAVRISISLPVIYNAQYIPGKTSKDYGLDTYADGGLFLNYPLTVFDGFKLSMDPKDELMAMYMAKYKPTDSISAKEVMEGFRSIVKDASKETNMKTIGFRLSSIHEPDYVFDFLSGGKEDNVPKFAQVPTTVLGQKFLKDVKAQKEIKKRENEVRAALGEFVRWSIVNNSLLEERSMDSKEGMPIEILLNALTRAPPRPEFRPQLFGYQTFREYLESLDISQTGHLYVKDIARSMDLEGGVNDLVIDNRKSQNVYGLGSFLLTSIFSIMNAMEEPMLKQEANLDRTCTLNTGYIDTLDFEVESGDLQFLAQSGKLQTVAFLNSRRSSYMPLLSDYKHGPEKRI